MSQDLNLEIEVEAELQSPFRNAPVCLFEQAATCYPPMEVNEGEENLGAVATETTIIKFTCKMFSKLVYPIPAFLSVVTGTLLPHSADAPPSVPSVQSLDAHATAPTLDFHNSTWIWTGEKPMPLGVRPFRKTLSTSKRKCPVCATILISRLVSFIMQTTLYSHTHSDDTYSIVVNDAEIGSGNGWRQPAVYTAGLQPENENVFAITVNNTNEDAALLIVTISVDYTDSTTETITTDNTWKMLKTVPPSGDNAYTLYLNDDNIDSGRDRRYAEAYLIGSQFKLDPDVNVIAVDGENFQFNSGAPNTAGVAAIILIAYSDGLLEKYYTDALWKTLASPPPAGFEQPGTDNSS
ncbi:uncharacterized protein ARMOST_08059 [Armillaria ostoyae]|uniref:Uncharacterized protein n=1 Tax=Armillaria ostoyae TaxID=47428 RepID=A0A284R7N1_ARMOS|nr:uncharacterized protein ARMOST_08059 [Armillaria ostoyae]